MGKFFKFLINLVLISVFLISGLTIYNKFSEYKKADEVYDEIKEAKDGEKINTKELAMKNPDYKMWIEVEGTNIDYPVVQSSDNDFYLYKDFNKDDSKSGSIFMDYRNDFEKDKNTIFYGHNMRNKTMFNQLERFKDEDFWNENRFIKLYTDSGIETYEIFSVYVTPSENDYLTTSFESGSEFNDYIKEIKSTSLYEYEGHIDGSDKIITLSTCSYEFDDARTVVHAKELVRE